MMASEDGVFTMESLRPPCLQSFCDGQAQVPMWQAALDSAQWPHYHIQGPVYSGKTYLLESSYLYLMALSRRAVLLSAQDVTHQTLLEAEEASWLCVDDLLLLTPSEQSVFMAWLDAACAAGRHVITTGPLMDRVSWYRDLASRLHASYTITLSYPSDAEAWARLIQSFFEQRYIKAYHAVLGELVQFALKDPEKVFQLMYQLAKQPHKLTRAYIRAKYANL